MSRLCCLLLLLFAVQGSMAQGFFEHCNAKKCVNVILLRELGEINFLPTTEAQLERYCPPVLEMLQCGIESLQECTGQTMFELSTSNNKTVAAIGHGIVTIGNLITDLCTPGTEMRENYLASIPCTKDLALDAELQMKCFQKGHAVFSTYEQSRNLLGEEISEEAKESEFWCMVAAYTLACFASEIHDTCGEVALKTYVDILKRAQSLKWNECTEVNVRNLKTEFLDFLELEDQRRDIFYSVFDSKKRK